MPAAPKPAAFVAGDGNIFFPALVALASIEEHNPGKFHRFMCFERQSLTLTMQRALDRHGIEFVDTASLTGSEAVGDMAKMDGRWPIEVFLNWLLPEHFARLGYEYCLKVDYDILCIRPYEDDLMTLADGQPFSAIKTGGSTELPGSIAIAVRGEVELEPAHPAAINVGFMLFNGKRCQEIGLFDLYRRTYAILASAEPRIFLDEQVAVAIILHTFCREPAYLSEKYNLRVRRHPAKLNGLAPDVANIHYNISQKPWKSLPVKTIQKFQTDGNPMVPFYRNAWIEYAMTLPEASTYLRERPLSALDLIGLASITLKATIPKPQSA